MRKCFITAISRTKRHLSTVQGAQLFFCLLTWHALMASTEAQARTAVTDASLSSPVQPLGQDNGWKLIFSDEFEGSKLDQTKWVTCFWWKDSGCTIATNKELQWYRSGNVAVQNGHLRLRAEKETFTTPSGKTFQYTSGMVSTGSSTPDINVAPKFAHQHMYVKMRAKVPTGQGLWPALWLLPVSKQALPEIDVVEILGNEPSRLHMALHYADDKREHSIISDAWQAPEPLDSWHTYAVDWRADSITWYVDGVLRSHVSGSVHRIPDEPMYIIANLAVGGTWPGQPDVNTRFPSFFEIDYIRAWTLNGG